MCQQKKQPLLCNNKHTRARMKIEYNSPNSISVPHAKNFFALSSCLMIAVFQVIYENMTNKSWRSPFKALTWNFKSVSDAKPKVDPVTIPDPLQSIDTPPFDSPPTDTQAHDKSDSPALDLDNNSAEQPVMLTGTSPLNSVPLPWSYSPVQVISKP